MNVGAVEYENRSLGRPLAELVGALAQCVLDGRLDLEEGERELLTHILRDVAAAGAHAWARLDQARALLATIDERTS